MHFAGEDFDLLMKTWRKNPTGETHNLFRNGYYQMKSDGNDIESTAKFPQQSSSDNLTPIQNNSIQINEESFSISVYILLILTLVVIILFLNCYSKRRNLRRKCFLLNKLGL